MLWKYCKEHKRMTQLHQYQWMSITFTLDFVWSCRQQSAPTGHLINHSVWLRGRRCDNCPFLYLIRYHNLILSDTISWEDSFCRHTAPHSHSAELEAIFILFFPPVNIWRICNHCSTWDLLSSCQLTWLPSLFDLISMPLNSHGHQGPVPYHKPVQTERGWGCEGKFVPKCFFVVSLIWRNMSDLCLRECVHLCVCVRVCNWVERGLEEIQPSLDFILQCI